ncbi:MAG: membrane dipeptidase [Akkermansiaceae bacterium]|nr:membrane dipeptidase [Akkermansiaceae bacterium]MCP5551539.1 membrane dipeptidase [Akkermansiaceae bacterium]
MERRNFIKGAAPLAVAGSGPLAAAAAVKAEETPENPVAALTDNLNPEIRKARDAAMAVLQPSPKDLQHGLELHADALVFDGYGFSPRAAIDGEALKQAVLAGASDIELEDLREEMGMTRYITDADEQREYREGWRASGVTCIFQNAGQEGQDPMRLIKRLARFTYTTDMLRDFVSKAVTPDDIEATKRAGKRCLYLTGNGVPLTQQWVSIPDELRYLRVFYQLGIRMMHLTYQRRNMIGDGCGEPGNAGLSDFGRAVIAEMNRVGVIPDCAHSGWRTSLEAAQISAKPVVASHSTAGALHAHIRSKPDEVIKALADSGGYIGICCISRFLRGKGDLNAFLDHIDHVAKKFGVDHVAIGTDIAYSSRNSAAESKKAAVGGLRRKREDFRSLWPKDDFIPSAEAAASLSWTNWPMFTVGLVQRGYSDDDIRKILGGNVMRVARASLVDTVAEG